MKSFFIQEALMGLQIPKTEKKISRQVFSCTRNIKLLKFEKLGNLAVFKLQKNEQRNSN